MASSQHGHAHAQVHVHPLNREDGQASSACNRPPLEVHQSLATGYPVTMGYPPAQSGYPIYNNQTYPSYPQLPHPLPKPKLSGFCRGIIGGLVFLTLFVIVISIITWLIFHPFLPTFHVHNFSVSNFNLSSAASFTADWDANVTVGNRNAKLKIYFNEVNIFIFRDRDVLASTGFNDFELDTKESRPMEGKLSAVNGTDSESAVAALTEERNSTGKVSVSLRMMSWCTFKSGVWLGKRRLVRVFCEDLKVGFADNNSSNGSLANGSDCLVVAD